MISDPGARNKPSDKHASIDTLWNEAQVREAVLRVWHRGAEWIEIHDTPIGLGLEYWLANDLLRYTDDPDFVRWLICDAPALLGWTDEPRSLRWALRLENFDQAMTEHSKRGVAITVGVDLERLKMPQLRASG